MLFSTLIGLLAAVVAVVYVSRAHGDGSPRIKGDAPAQLVSVLCAGGAGFALTGLLAMALN